MKITKITAIVILTLGILFFFGPKVSYAPIASPDIELMDDLPLSALDDFIAGKEKLHSNIRPDNEARIIWADSTKAKTRYSIVYLHGFSASHEEGNPVHLDLAKRYGLILYLARLFMHGLEGLESMTELTPNGLIESAKEAIAIGQLLGEDVILMSTSTGGTLSIYLAGANPELIDALILFSPNIEIADQSAKVLTMPWGLQLGKLIAGDFRSFEDSEPHVKQYWTTKYRIEAIAALQSLLDQTMSNDVFAKVNQPYLLGYYYKNDSAMDHTVSIDAIKAFNEETATPENQKSVVAFTEVGAHVVASYITSKDLESVGQAVYDFTDRILQLTPASESEVQLITEDF